MIRKEDYSVKLIDNKDSYPYLLEIHYAKRIPSISYTYGLFRNDELVGVVCYGTPSSPTLRRGVAGDDNIPNVLELNRLCLKDNLKNEASLLVGKSLKILPKGKFIISYADSSQDHFGYVYQACNFTYHGLSAKRTDYALKSRPELHNTSVGDLARGQKNRAQWLRDNYPDDFYLKPRPRKHRYIYITGKGKQRKILANSVKYKLAEYPKKEETPMAKIKNRREIFNDYKQLGTSIELLGCIAQNEMEITDEMLKDFNERSMSLARKVMELKEKVRDSLS